MNKSEINNIIENQTSISQISLIVTSILFQFLVFIGYIRKLILNQKELTFFLSPFLFLSLLMMSISFGLEKNNNMDLPTMFNYLLIILLLFPLLLIHFFYRKLLKYKMKIHFWSLVVLGITILFSIILLI